MEENNNTNFKRIYVIMRSYKDNYYSKGYFDGNGLTVLTGSIVNKTVNNTVGESERNEIKSKRALYLDKNYRLIKDVYFNSPSAASNFVAGCLTDGWIEWVTPDGKKLQRYRNVFNLPSNSTEEINENNFLQKNKSTDFKGILVIMRSYKCNYYAKGYFDGKGLTVLKDSTVNRDVKESAKNRIATARALYLDEKYRVIKDVYFKTPSAASNFVAGRSANGWDEWVTPEGEKLQKYRNAFNQTATPTDETTINNVISKKESDDRDTHDFPLIEPVQNEQFTTVSTNSENTHSNIFPEPLTATAALDKQQSFPETANNQISLNDTTLQSETTAYTKTKESKEIIRLEKKMDLMLEIIKKLYIEKDNDTQKNEQESEDSNICFRIEPTQYNAPILIIQKPTIITGLIFNLKLSAVGLDKTTAQVKLFLANKHGQRLSNINTIQVTVGEEFNCRFELNPSVSEEKSIFLVIQSDKSQANEAKQLIECLVKIAFAADFGI